MIRTLGEQVREKRQQELTDATQSQVDARAMEEDARRGLELDLRRMRKRKSESYALRDDLLQMIEDKEKQRQRDQAFERGEGDSGLPAGAVISQRLDAARFLDKPLGRVQAPFASSPVKSRGHLEQDKRSDGSPWRSPMKLPK